MKDNNNISQEIFEAIERYINGTMEASELKDFNDYLKIDPEFRAQVEDHKMKHQSDETEPSKESLITTIPKQTDKTEIPKSTPKKGHYLFSRMTAIGAIIIAVGSIWFFSSSPNQKIYSDYFEPYPALTTELTTTSNFDFYDAMLNYRHKNYNLAIKKWKKLSVKKPDNDTLNYFLGVALLADKDVDKAIPYLQKTIETTNTDFSFLNDAYYYLGLSYLNEGDINLAKKYLTLSNTRNSKEVILKLPD